MKRSHLLAGGVLLLSATALAQSVKIHLNNGESVEYPAEDVLKVEFLPAAGLETPLPTVYSDDYNYCFRYLNGWFGRDFNEGVVNQGDEIMGCCYGVGNYFDDGRYLNASIHSLTSDNWSCNMIGGCMDGAKGLTELIDRLGNEDKESTYALRAMRAYYHFWMMELWGDAPIIDEMEDLDSTPQRSPRAEVARWIEKELLESMPHLTKANDETTYGKANYWMACALLAKVYLNWGVYTHDITTVDIDTPNEKINDCVRCCDELIKSGVFEVGVGYRKKFFPDNGVHVKDFIFAIDADPDPQFGKVDGTTTWYRWFGFKKDGLCRPYSFGWENPLSVAGQTILTKEALERFCLPGDERNKMVLQGPQYTFDTDYEQTDIPVYIYTVPSNEKTLVGQLNYHTDFDFDDASIYSLGDEALPKANKENIANGTALLNIQKGARLFKYPAREEDYTLWNRQQANDTPILRFADILLMKAECLLRGAEQTLGDTPESLVNTVRDCASAPHVEGALTFQQLLDERSRELILEPWRRNDLIRFGQFEADWGQKNSYKVWDDEEHVEFHWEERPGVKDPNRRLMPLHHDVLDSNPGWTQNPGY